ncbi:hypothetical protein [Photorhabdus hindustanensis]|nr:hypothetical protein [Photorhabdus hindustanensis]
MIKLSKKQALKVVKTTVKVLCYLKSAVKKMTFNNGLKPAHYKAINGS